MEVQRKGELSTFLDKLHSADPAEAVQLLKKIEKMGQDTPGTAAKITPFLNHPDYLVRSRAFIAIGRIKDDTVSRQLLDYIETSPGEEWQLRVLEALYLFNDRGVVSRLSLILDQHHAPLLTRGATWLLGYLGGQEALDLLLEFAASPSGRIVKSEIIYEGVALALKSLDHADEYWMEVINGNTSIARFFHYSKLPEIDQPRFSVYPYPDYLLDQAIAQGIKPKEFKKLYHWEREN